jgi:hypothetical protein
MIPYEELSAALERWRVKNGLPGTPPLFAEGSSMKRPAAIVAPTPAPAPAPAPVQSWSAPAPSFAPPAAAARPAPMPMPPPPSPQTLDESVDEFADDDVLDEASLDNEGPDFAMSFGGSGPAARPSMSAEDEHEATQIGVTDPSIVPPPANPGWDHSPPRAPAGIDDDDLDEYNSADKTPA